MRQSPEGPALDPAGTEPPAYTRTSQTLELATSKSSNAATLSCYTNSEFDLAPEVLVNGAVAME